MEKIQTNQYVDEANSTMLKVFFRMFLGLLATGLTALYTYQSGLYLSLLSGSTYIVMAVIEFIVVLAFTFLFKKLPPLVVTILFYSYAFLNGFVLSVVFAVFEMNSIFLAFFATALLFGGLALYGYTTKRDITKFGPILMVTLIAGVIISLVNMFLGNRQIDIVLDWVMLIVFAGLTIYDINKIKEMSQELEQGSEKLYIYGAMQLYLDFINLFIRILSIIGKRKN